MPELAPRAYCPAETGGGIPCSLNPGHDGYHETPGGTQWVVANEDARSAS